MGGSAEHGSNVRADVCDACRCVCGFDVSFPRFEGESGEQVSDLLCVCVYVCACVCVCM